MLNNISISKYVNTNSFIHKLNSIEKIISCTLFLIISLLTKNYYAHLIYIMFLCLLIIFSKIPIKNYLKSLKTVLYLIIGIFIINLSLNVSLKENLINIYKIIEIVIYSSIITISTKENEMLNGIIVLLKPLKKIKINANELAVIFMLTIKFIPSIIDSINKILLNLKSRGINFKRNRILLLKSIIIPTFNLTLKKADDMALSMEVRYYDLNNIKISFENKWKIIDSIIIVIHILLLIGVIICDI